MKFFSFFILFLSYSVIQAQIVQPELGWIFDDSVIGRVDIIIDQDSLDELLLEENWFEDHEYPASMIFTKYGIADTVDNVGFRLRGNTSRESAKKSFKIAINSFTPGERYEGQKKLNLNGEHNDPSIARSKLNWDLLRENELPSTRTVHTEFYINDVYNGLYIIVEHINDDFLSLRYGNNSGNLYKCLWPANLNYISSDPNDYKFENNGRRTYDLKNNTDLDDYSDLANFIDVLNNTNINDLYCELSKVLDVEDFLEILAIDVMTGNWDGYSFNKNNFYLYHNPKTDRFQYIPYDLDNTLGIDWFSIDWTERNIYNWSSDWDYLPLYERIMDNPEMKAIFTFYLNQIIMQFDEESFESDIDDLRDLIAPFAELDTFRIIDYGFSYDEFLDSFDGDIPYDHVDSGIKPFYSNRSSSASDQVQSQDIAPIIRYTQVQPLRTLVPISIKTFIEDEEQPESVWAFYNYQSIEDSILLYDDGLHGDGDSLDGWYANVLDSFDEEGVLGLYIVASDQSDQSRTLPCDPYEYVLEAGSSLLINEFMAKNDSTIQDDLGNFSDWVEIYNNSDQAVSLSDYYLSDDMNNASKWAFPDVSIDANGYYLIWCSGDTSLGENHAGFKLSASGEDVALFQAFEEDTVLIDGLSFGIQYSDTSFGREIDAHPNWIFFPVPTPNASNGMFPLSISNESISSIQVSAFPNPFKEELFISNDSDENIECDVFSIQGKLIAHFELKANQTIPYNDSYSSGIRFLKCTSNGKAFMLKLIKQ